MGIQLNSTKSRSTEDIGESTRLDFQVEFSEIHLLREAGSSVLEILKLDLVSFVYVPVQPRSPVRAETEIKLGGTQCNIIMSRLKPWLLVQSSKKKRMVLREESSVVKQQSSDIKIIMWTCNVSAPEMTIVLFNMVGSPVYHIYDFDRDYKDVGVAQFTTKYFVARNCLPNAKSDMLLSAWNPPQEWVKKVMLRVDAKQGAPRVEILPLNFFR
ncbi:hypothetical protein PIB30_050897 [Stylosanthes scabra]|uniref:Uncharacterized protein n=1 Tax=Stylosanthes scabra TaxID=79078 RepID=A0ABU6XFG5_9FABA|nr:hypothetical protein [Stylosanthes scabra]